MAPCSRFHRKDVADSIPSYKALPTWCGGGQPDPPSTVVCGGSDRAGTGSGAYSLLLCHQTYHQISPPCPRANSTRPSGEIQPPRPGLVPKLLSGVFMVGVGLNSILN